MYKRQGTGLGVAVGRHVYVLEKDQVHNAIVLGDDSALYASSLLASHVDVYKRQAGLRLRRRHAEAGH